MAEIVLAGMFGIYLAIAPCFFKSWFQIFQREADKLSPEEKQLSLATLITASVLWPVVVPISYAVQLSKEIEPKKEKIQRKAPSGSMETARV